MPWVQRTGALRSGRYARLMALNGGRDVESGGLQGRLYASTLPAERGPRPSYVLLHGIGVSHRYLARLHLELAGAADVYSFDLPGFGGTPRPARQLQVADYAAFVASVLARSAVRNAVVVGHSMGTQFAVDLALKEPGQVAGAVLMGPVVEPGRKTVHQQGTALSRDAMFSESLSANAIVFSDYLRTGLRWYLTELPVMLAYQLESKLAGVTQPVLVLRGARDPVARRSWCERLSSVAPHGTLAEIPGQGHVLQHTAPESAARTITGWVRATDAFGVSAKDEER